MEQQDSAGNPYSWMGWFAPLNMNGLGPVTRLMQASCESAIQIWSTTVQGSIEQHKKQLSFVSMRLQKNLDMAANLSRCSDLQNVLNVQADYGRDLIEDYLQSNQEVAQSMLELYQDVQTPVAEVVEKVNQDDSDSGGDEEKVSQFSKRRRKG